MLTISWTRFFVVVTAGYLAVNFVFASAYYLCGAGALHGTEGLTVSDRIVECFFFSVQTFTTIGYGRINPMGLAANILVAIEGFVGLLGFAFATGLSLARFSRPNAKILFSYHAIIAPYRGITGFEFRMINQRNNQLIDVSVGVTLAVKEVVDGKEIRKFHELPLERTSVRFFPLNWTIVHPIDESSPLYGMSKESLESADAEFLVLVSGTDEIFSQQVHARSSYKHHEVIVGAQFKDMFEISDDGLVSVDLRKVHDYEVLEGAA
jgi:inward rectifier potassium channel